VAKIFVRPGDVEIRDGLVAISDADPAHIEADERWEHFGGVFIAGNPAKPDAVYAVADTPYVHECIAKRRLVQVPTPGAGEVNADIPVTVEAPAPDPIDLAWSALSAEQKQLALAAFAAGVPTAGEPPVEDIPPAEETPKKSKGK
jgi:hypothetical protein